MDDGVARVAAAPRVGSVRIRNAIGLSVRQSALTPT